MPPDTQYAQRQPQNCMAQSWVPVMDTSGLNRIHVEEVVIEHWAKLARSLLLMRRRVIVSEGKCLLGQCRANFHASDFRMTREIIRQRPEWVDIFHELSDKVTSSHPGDLPSGHLRPNQQPESPQPQRAWTINSIDSHSQVASVHDQGMSSVDSAAPREPWMLLQTYDSLPDVGFLPSATVGTVSTPPDVPSCMMGFRTMDSLPEVDEQEITPDVRYAINSFLHVRGRR